MANIWEEVFDNPEDDVEDHVPTMTYIHHVPTRQAVTVHGGAYDVGDKGYCWTMEWPLGTIGKHHTQDVTFTPGEAGTYILTLPVVDGQVVITLIAHEE